MTVVVLAAAPLVVVMTLATWHWARAAAPRRIDALVVRPGPSSCPPTAQGPRAALGAIAAVLVPTLVERRRRRRLARAVADDLPEVLDLMALVAGAGFTPAFAVEAVGRHSSGPVGLELARAHRQAGGGARLADALDGLTSRLGDEVRPLTAVLVASERYGAPLVDGLERVAADVRLQRQRRAEEAAGQIPVRLLFPLVGCILPAFALLTVAPLLAGALRSLRH